MKKAGGLIDAVTLLLVFVLIGWFVLSGEDWRLLNPKFMWLTAASALFILLITLVGLRYPRMPSKGSRFIILLSLVGFLFLGNPRIQVTATTDESGGTGSRILLNGIEYIKINIGELYFILTIQSSDEGDEPDAAKGHYVMRGVVKHHPELKKEGQFMLMRTVVWCCVADAAGTGFRVLSSQLDGFTDGEWVQVFGRLKALTPTPEPIFMRFGKTLVTRANKDYFIIPDKIVKTSPPAETYVYNRETKEPFNY